MTSKNFHSLHKLPRTIEIASDGRSVRIINQTKLPYELSFVEITQWERMVEAIQRLEIRGAPALGVAGAAAIGIFITYEAPCLNPVDFLDRLEVVRNHVANARPTAVNLSWGTNRAAKVAHTTFQQLVNETLPDAELYSRVCKAVTSEVAAIQQEDEACCRSIGTYGAALLPSQATVLTHCNAGSLATSFFGTALGIIYAAFEQEKIVRVYADETRPVGQGARLTAWELAQVGVPTTLICDNMAASLMAQGEIDAVIVGADRICANGDTANKIGTYGLAVLAHYHHIPFYVAAPCSTFDFNLTCGSEINIEQRNPEEVLPRAIKGVDIYNPAFDITPAELISAFITEKGVYTPSQVELLNS